MTALTKSQVNKAGKSLRGSRRSDKISLLQYANAFDVLLAFRAAHQYPLTKATLGLRSMVTTEGCQVEVSQRLKRVPTILDKLRREPTMQLANMQDIGDAEPCSETSRSFAGFSVASRRIDRRFG